MSQIETHCPHCGTSFSVSSEQLQIAQGHVRCGVCMKVFKAGAAPAPKVAETKSQIVEAKGDLNLDDDSSIEAWIKKNQKAANKNIQSGPVEAPTGDISVDSLRFDDELSDAFENLKPAPQPGSKDFTLEKLEKEEDLFLELEKKEKEKVLSKIGDPKSRVREIRQPAQEPVEHFHAEENSFGNTDFASDFDDDPFALGDDEPIVHVTLGSTEIEEPITFEERLKPRILWPSLATSFALILFAQVLISNFTQWSEDNRYRGFYSVFCSIGLCELPPLRDVNRIRGSNLIVRPHPHIDNALIVDAIINNQAPFAQAFPKLFLSFSDVHGKVIASRIFEPREYLTGELKGLTALPSRSPLHLSLEILDPGTQAVNYQIDFIDS